MIVLKASDLDLSKFSEKDKWPNGLEVKEREFGVLLVSKSCDLKEYYPVEHDYNTATKCPCPNHVEGYKVCKHMRVANFVLNQRKERFKKPTPVSAQTVTKSMKPVTDPVTIRMEKAPLNGSRAFNLYR